MHMHMLFLGFLVLIFDLDICKLFPITSLELNCKTILLTKNEMTVPSTPALLNMNACSFTFCFYLARFAHCISTQIKSLSSPVHVQPPLTHPHPIPP